jgi:hypothetical protein
MSGVSKEKPNADRDSRRGMGIFLDEPFQKVMALYRCLFDRVRTLRGGVNRLTIGVLNSTRGLLNHALRFHLAASGKFSSRLLDLAANIASGADHPSYVISTSGVAY